MRRNRATSLVLILLAAVIGLTYTIASGNSPQLGLDLQGGASVTLQPPEGTPRGTVNQAIEIIRSRVDALGVAEPQITRQGNAVVVELPGVKNQQRAVEVVGTTAELRFRPVLNVLAAESPTTTTTSTTAPGSAATAGASTTTSTTSTTVPPGTTPREENTATATVILPGRQVEGEEGVRYVLGPAALLGKSIKGASAQFDPAGGGWTVVLELKADGRAAFNGLAGQCYSQSPSCPTNQLAIELDGVVQSAPTFQTPSFDGDVSITGNFSEKEAKDLALVLRYGSLPVQLEAQAVRTVSATLGRDSLNAGLIAGLTGAALVLLYMVFYYRALGLVVLAGLCVWFALQWTIISYLGNSSGLALSLAGVTGIVVSIGVTVDSYVVYFERLKDEMRKGRSVRSAVDRGFQSAFRTIVIADTTSLLGAGILYWRTVGAVRGFAFFLGLSTLLDMVVAWGFTRPFVSLLARRGHFSSSSFIGVRPADQPVADAVEGAEA